ncbi:MAG TPA: hypothetical protein VGG95_11625, partial [Edaphobacter sp.]|jgi:hypothetical protein
MECSSIFCGIAGAKIREVTAAPITLALFRLFSYREDFNGEDDTRTRHVNADVCPKVTGCVFFERIIGDAFDSNQYEVRV